MKNLIANLKSNRRTLLKIVATSSLALVSVVMGFNCSGFQAANYPFNHGSSSVENQALQEQLPVALLSSEQMLKAMISATGTEGLGDDVTPQDDQIVKTFEERKGSLPSGQLMNNATGPTLISASNVAAAVCAKAVSNDMAFGEAQRDERLFFREMDFSKGLAMQNSDGVTMAFERLARNAWRREASQDEVTQIMTFAQEFSREADPAAMEQTQLLATSVCTAVLSSIDALTY